MQSEFGLSLAHATLLSLAPADLIRVAHAAGFSAVGLRLIPIGLPGERPFAIEHDPAGARAIRDALDETGVRLLDVELIRITDSTNPQSYGPALEAAAALGAQFALANVYTADNGRASATLAQLCELAAPLAITLLLEPVSFSDVRTSRHAAEIVRACGRPNAGLLIDTLHQHSSGESPAVLEELAVPVPLVHINDAPAEVPMDVEARRRIAREERLLPGEGGIDLAAMLPHLPRDVVYAVEAHNPARAAALGPAAYARLAFEKTSRCLRTVFGRSS